MKSYTIEGYIICVILLITSLAFSVFATLIDMDMSLPDSSKAYWAFVVAAIAACWMINEYAHLYEYNSNRPEWDCGT